MTEGTIDVHSHIYPLEIAGWPTPPHAARWPCMTRDGVDAATIRRGDQFYRAIDSRSWDLDRRLADMDAHGVALQVLSPTPVSYAYDAPADAVADCARAQNDAIAKMVHARPDRFAGFGTVALQDVDRACTEVERLRDELNLAGIEIGTVVGELTIDDPRYEALWATCERSGAVVFIHPESTLAPERFTRFGMVLSTAYPSETGVTAATLLLAGTLERYPHLRMLLAHGGGTLAWLLPRIEQAWRTMPNPAAPKTNPREAARRLWADTLVYDPANLRLIAERFGDDHLVVGSDYPFPIAEVPPAAAVNAELRAKARANAVELLSL